MTDDGLSDLAARYISGQPIGSQSEGFRALPPRDEILDREDIGLRMGVNRQYIDILIEKGDFPRPCFPPKQAGQAAYWRVEAVEEHIKPFMVGRECFQRLDELVRGSEFRPFWR